ncbi:MAG: ribonucleoside triphosphate reductase [bacterium]|nr:ribonucleoside triphosphate reductase [bacterium]
MSTYDKYFDVEEYIDSFLAKTDWEVKENANQLYSFSSLLLRAGGEVIRRYLLCKVYPPEIREAYLKGYMHIHDLPFGVVGYCCGWDMRLILLRGFGGVQGRIYSRPPRHLDTVIAQMVNFLGTMQMEFAGAQALSHVDVYLAPFVRHDRLNYKQVKQNIQRLVYHLNVPSRWGCQTPFTNFTLDIHPPEILASHPAIVGGQYLDRTYEEYEEEIEMINLAFVEILAEGDGHGRPFTFPIITYNITKDFPFDSDLAETIFAATGKFGYPYFQNYIGSGFDPNTIYAMCCRLNLDKRALYIKGFGFHTGENTGSLGVVTLNLALLGYEAKKDEDKFFELLEKYANLAKEALEIKRRLVERNFRLGLMPFTRLYIDSFDRYFNTIGVCGMHEALLNMGFEDGIASPEGHRFAVKTLLFLRELIKQFQEETNHLYNLEATPAESASYSLAIKARKLYPDIILSGTPEVPYLTNSTWLPEGYTDDLYFIIRHQEPLQRLYTGGTVLHLWIGEQLDAEAVRTLVEKVCSTRIPYFSITPTFSICPTHGYLPGRHFTCPHCGTRCEIWSRIVGYYRPLQFWNLGKYTEFFRRKELKISSGSTTPVIKYSLEDYISVEEVLAKIG